MEKFTQFLNFVSYKYKLTFDTVMKDFEEFVKEEKENIIKSCLEDDYKTFLDNNEEELEKKFGITHNFQTSTRGLKVRGVFPSLEEAELRCKMLIACLLTCSSTSKNRDSTRRSKLRTIMSALPPYILGLPLLWK